MSLIVLEVVKYGKVYNFPFTYYKTRNTSDGKLTHVDDESEVGKSS